MHLIHETDVCFLEDLNVGNGLPRQRGETAVKGKVPEKSVNSVEEWAGGRSFTVGETKTQGFCGFPFILCAPGVTILVWCDSGYDQTEAA